MQIAALIQDPFPPDPLNAYALVPVAINSFLPQTLSLALVHRYGTKSWYLLGLTIVGWALASVVLWAVTGTLQAPSTKVTAGDSPISSVPSCGSSSALELCIWGTGATPLNSFTSSLALAQERGISTAPAVWAWCTLCLLGMICDKILNVQGSADRAREDPAAQNQKGSLLPRVRLIWLRCVALASSTACFFVVSLLFFLCFAYLFFMFHGYLSFGLVDLTSWSFGQVVAITVWIAPVVEFIHLLFSRFQVFGHNLRCADRSRWHD